MKDLNQETQITTLDKGSRFCHDSEHFLIRNKIYIPYSYYSLMMTEKNKNGNFDIMLIDPECLFCYNNQTIFHLLAKDYKNLKKFLDFYTKNEPEVLNLILKKNNDDMHMLEIAHENNDSRCVNLLLDIIYDTNMANTIHLLKHMFPLLLNYSSFVKYLEGTLF